MVVDPLTKPILRDVFLGHVNALGLRRAKVIFKCNKVLLNWCIEQFYLIQVFIIDLLFDLNSCHVYK